MYRGLPREGFERAVLKNRVRTCPRCGAPLRFAYRRKRRLILLRERLALEVDADRCCDAGCPLSAGFGPPEEARLALPKFTYGLDVLTEIARLRWVGRNSVPEMHEELREVYGLPISERNVDYLVQTWQELATAWVLRDRGRIDALERQGGIILAIDGLQPEKGHETLYLFRDTISQTNLLTCPLSNSSSDRLAETIEVVKGLGVTILGVVTDKQQSLVLAVDKALPGTPYQLCQFHFFRDLARPVMEVDRAMKKGIKKKLRGIAPVERKLADSKEAKAASTVRQARAYCVALRATLQDDGKPPLDPGGLKMVDRLRRIDRSLARSQKKGASRAGSLARRDCEGSSLKPAGGTDSPRLCSDPRPGAAPGTTRFNRGSGAGRGRAVAAGTAALATQYPAGASVAGALRAAPRFVR